VSAERGVEVSVVDDQSAFVGIERPIATAAVAETEPSQSQTTNGTGENETRENESTVDTASVTDESTATPTSEQTTPLLSVTNRFEVPVTVQVVGVREVETGAEGMQVSPTEESLGLGTGERDDLTATITCGTEGGETKLSVDLLVTGDSVHVELTREVTVTCA